MVRGIVRKFLSVSAMGTALLFSGCSMSTTDLAYRNDRVLLQLGHAHIQMPATKVAEQLENFSTLYVTHTLIRFPTGSLAVVDKARTDTRYEFNYPLAHTLKVVFDAKALYQIYYNSSFYVFQLLLADGSYINVMAEQLDDQGLNMVYGMDNDTLRTFLEPLVQNIGSLHPVRTIKGKEGAILGRWTSRKVHLEPLVVPRRDMTGI